jgi:large conductance mechanosensitive channel
MSFVSEFKSFAMKGNVVDMAVGIIIGVAFGKVVASLVRDVIMQPIGVLVGGVDFSELAYIIQEAQDEAAAVAINYGLFIQSIVDFLIVAFAIFMAVKVMNTLKKKEEVAPVAPAKPSTEVVLLTEIRDFLKR